MRAYHFAGSFVSIALIVVYHLAGVCTYTSQLFRLCTSMYVFLFFVTLFVDFAFIVLYDLIDVCTEYLAD